MGHCTKLPGGIPMWKKHNIISFKILKFLWRRQTLKENCWVISRHVFSHLYPWKLSPHPRFPLQQLKPFVLEDEIIHGLFHLASSTAFFSSSCLASYTPASIVCPCCPHCDTVLFILLAPFIWNAFLSFILNTFTFFFLKSQGQPPSRSIFWVFS